MKATNIKLLKDYEIIKGIKKPAGSKFRVTRKKCDELIKAGVAEEISEKAYNKAVNQKGVNVKS